MQHARWVSRKVSTPPLSKACKQSPPPVDSDYFVRGGESSLRTRGMVVSHCVHMARQLRSIPWKWRHQKINRFIRRFHPYGRKPASRAVLSRMELTLHAIRSALHGASRLAQATVCLVGESPTRSNPAKDARIYAPPPSLPSPRAV